LNLKRINIIKKGRRKRENPKGRIVWRVVKTRVIRRIVLNGAANAS